MLVSGRVPTLDPNLLNYHTCSINFDPQRKICPNSGGFPRKNPNPLQPHPNATLPRNSRPYFRVNHHDVLVIPYQGHIWGNRWPSPLLRERAMGFHRSLMTQGTPAISWGKPLPPVTSPSAKAYATLGKALEVEVPVARYVASRPAQTHRAWCVGCMD